MHFFLIVLAVHALVNFYLALRGWQALEAAPALRPWWTVFMVLMFVAYPLGRWLEKLWFHPLPIGLHWIGSFWFAVMLYATLMVVLIDLGRLLNLAWPWLPTLGADNMPLLKLRTLLVVFGATLLIVVGGHINAWYPKIVRLDLTLPKQAGQLEYLRIVAASDVHLGTIIGPRKTAKLVATINSLNPDVILFAGDVVDEDVKPVIKQNLGENLRQLHAPYGVYAATGNHEYIGGGEPSIRYLEEHGIKMLRDTALLVNEAFYLVGREDLHKRWAKGEERKSLPQILEGADPSKPLILLDHQPYRLEEAEQAGIDLQLSGHTHHGQLWPFGYITQKIFEVSRGYHQKGNTHYYVSTGFGTWGPPVRTGNRPEIMVINLYFKE